MSAASCQTRLAPEAGVGRSVAGGTALDEVIGGLADTAPECLEPGGQVDCRADIYSLGACLYTLLAGRPPFVGRGKVELIKNIRFTLASPPSIDNLSIPAPLEGLALKCLAKHPTDRFSRPHELWEDLEEVKKFRN